MSLRRSDHWNKAPAGAGRASRMRAGPRADRGTVLIVTMWVVLALAGLVLILARTMLVESTCSANEACSLQADAVEQGAIQYVLARVDSLFGQVPTDTDMPCQAIQIGDGAFWIIRPNYDDGQTYAYGLTDEASKLNLNTATLAMLSMLPDMTDELAPAIVDWRRSDSNVTSGGAKDEYYMRLSDPYQCKSSPLETVEELFLVKGATQDIVYGDDFNRNGILDVHEGDSNVTATARQWDNQMDRGLFPFVTVYSAESNVVSSSGTPRIDVNNAQSSQSLTDLLQKNVAAGRLPVVLNRIRMGRPFRNLLDFYFRTALTIDEFRTIADQLTTSAQGVQKGLINVKTAPQEVLACLPGLADTDVSALVAKRSEAGTDANNIAWVAQALTREKAIAVGSYITTQSYQFSADIVSVTGNGRAFRRCRIVVDAQSSPPKVIYRQDLTHLGWPLAPEILTGLRAGVSLDEVAAAQQSFSGSTR
jgi:type II secretory pathway component PulK